MDQPIAAASSRPGVSRVLTAGAMPPAMLAALGGAGRGALAAFPADLAPDGRFAERWLAVCRDGLAAIEPDGAGGFRAGVREPFRGVTGLEYRGEVGGGVVLVRRGKEQRELVRCSRACDRAIQAALGKLRTHLGLDQPQDKSGGESPSTGSVLRATSRGGSAPPEGRTGAGAGADAAAPAGAGKAEKESPEPPPREALPELSVAAAETFLRQLTELGEQRYCAKCGLPLKQDSSVCPVCVSRGRTLWRIFSFAGAYRRSLVLLFGLLTATILFRVVPPHLQGRMFDEALIPGRGLGGEDRRELLRTLGADGPITAERRAELVRRLEPAAGLPRQERVRLLLVLVGALFAANLFAVLLRIWSGRLAVVAAGAISRDVRGQVFRHLQYLSLGYFDRHKTGALMSRVSSDTNMLQNFLVNGVQYSLVSLLEVLIISGVLLALNWRLALLVLLPAPLVVLLTKYIFRTILQRFRRVWEAISRMSAVLNDSLRGVRVVKAFGGERQEIERFEARSRAFFGAELSAEKYWISVTPLLGLIMGTGLYFVLGLGGTDMIMETSVLGPITPGLMVQFIAYLPMLYGPLQMMTRLNEWLTRSMTAAERIFEILDTRTEVPEAADPVPMPAMQGEVELRGVTFGYEKHSPVIRGMSLRIAAGEMIGLAGHSGAGKSTTINLIARLYDVDEGQVLIDGVDVRRIPLADLRRQVGVVLQETFLFSGTIHENLAYARPGADPEKIVAAARLANAHGFIMNRPDGYDSEVEENGGNFSSGEKQRLAIARAILHDPRILILDEATSSVDTKTEKQIQEALGRLTAGRTTIAIAHRLSTLAGADRLAVIDKGEVRELGTHRELVEQKGIYHDLVKTQTEMTSVIAVGG